MIYCPLKDLKQYSSLSPNFKTAVDYLLSNDLNKLPFGKTVIDGENIFINKSNIELSDDADSFEVHHRYIDIHINLESDNSLNGEFIVSAYKDLAVVKSYEEKEDYELLTVKSSCGKYDQIITSLTPRFCAVYFTGEPHKPGIMNKKLSCGSINPPRKLVKCVVKVLDDRK